MVRGSRIAGATATALLGSSEVTDANTASPGALAGTRYYAFGGTTVALRDGTGVSYLIGDVQGSATVLIPAGDGTGDPDAVVASRNAYTPYGVTRGDDNLATDRGWLGQVEDQSSGLTYLNARYYDPAIARFISPDPLMDPTDPRTLDPYRYADNNPIQFSDASGLAVSCAGQTGQAYINCNTYSNEIYNPLTGKTKSQKNEENAKSGKAPVNKTKPKSTSHKNSADPGIIVKPKATAIGGGPKPKATPSLFGLHPGYGGNSGFTGTHGAKYSAAQVGFLLSQPSNLKQWSDPKMVDAMAAALTYAYLTGGKSYDKGPICGVYAVCVSGVPELGAGENTMTIGLVVISERNELSAWLQFHEYTHVVDEMDEGWDSFSGNYPTGAWYAGLRGEDLHAGSAYEKRADRVASLAVKSYTDWLGGSSSTELRFLPSSVMVHYAK